METFVPVHAPDNLFSWSNPSWRVSPGTHTVPTGDMGERIGSIKVRKLTGGVTGNLIVTAKAVHASQAK